MWIDVAIVALFLGACAFLKRPDWRTKRPDWHTRFLTCVRTAGSRRVKAAGGPVPPEAPPQ